MLLLLLPMLLLLCLSTGSSLHQVPPPTSTSSAVPPPSPSLERPRAEGVPRETKELLNKEWEFRSIKDVRFKLARFDRFVPVIGSQQRRAATAATNGAATIMPFLAKRQQLFDYGCYPGVEYRIVNILYNQTTPLDSLSGLSNADESRVQLSIRPAYKLIPQLERDWPVQVPLSAIPWCLSRGAYNVVTVAGSASLAASFLFLSFLVSLSLTLSVVNTRSMEPAIMPKDVMLVEKVSPIFARLFRLPVAQQGDIVFFNPPPAMSKYISENKLPEIRKGNLLVKRVESLRMLEQKSRAYSVLGDNQAVSLDSRTWGDLGEEDIVGKPLLRVLPLNRLGPLSGK